MNEVMTLVFTDVVGSTSAWEAEPDMMRLAMVRHDDIVAAIARDSGGRLIKPRGEGDSCFLVFAEPIDGVRAAADLVRDLAREPWPTTKPIQVRIAVHTAPIEGRDGDYYGPGVNRTARIRALGHGGQILVSQATTTLVTPYLHEDESLRNLGPHELRDIADAEMVHQFHAPGLETLFPALRVPIADIRSTTPLRREWGPPAEIELPDGRRVPLAVRAATIGRQPDCEIFLDYSSVSRAHAQIRTLPEGHMVVDLGSTNGVLVGDQVVTEQMLEDGDEITLGSVKVTYRRV